MINLQGLDLNLLRTLNVLLSENNVTRAAQRLNLSQPSVSVQLARLREIFADPLLLPGPRGMQPTARADELRGPLRDALFELQPARLVQQADRDEVDLFFHTRDGAPPGLHQRLLFRERYVLAGRAGHPALRSPLSLAQFCQLEQVIVSPDGGGFSAATDSALANLGLARRVVLSVPHFLFMLETLRNSELVAVLPERLVRGAEGLTVVEPPLAVAGFEMLMLWHERWHRDPAHRWLRQQIVTSLEEKPC
ncbi:LysR family transcriptional regulator [Klebsiella michiganensis]|uniref:LysR family transcriptional regulator n=1 Tax=Klebsiella michiganensis TaxID=1134687 RepID=UPI003DA7E274